MFSLVKSVAIILLFCPKLVFGQVEVQIMNLQSDKHVRLKGSTLNIIVPEGFVASSNFVGFQQQESGSSIVLNHIENAPYEEMINGFTKEALATRGVRLIKTDSVNINHSTRKGRLLHSTISAAGNEYSRKILVLSSPTGVDLLVCNYPFRISSEYDLIMGLVIRTLFFSDEEPVNPDEALDFTLSSEGTPLIRKNIMLSTIGLIYSEDDKGEVLMATKSVRPLSSDDLQGASIALAKTLPKLVDLKVTERNSLEVDGMKAYEIVGEATYQGAIKGLVYQLITVTEGAYYRVGGESKSLNKAHIEDFRKVARTLRRK
jgi:hypothetical protein